MNLWSLNFTISADIINPVEEHLDALELTYSSFESGKDFQVDIIFQEKPDEIDIESIMGFANKISSQQIKPTVQEIENKDWVKENQKNFPPIEVGSFYIYGSHIDLKTDKPFPILIDANTAFGTGQHETTKGCLIAMEDLSKNVTPSSILDMGCGTAILAIAAKMLFGCEVVGIDNDPESIKVSKENAKLNQVSINCAVGDGYKSLEGHFDVIISNILAGPLINMAQDLSMHLNDGGHTILAGLLETQASEVQKAHEEVGLALVNKKTLNEWTILVMKKA